MSWQKTLPTSSTYIISIPGIFQGNWTECENTLGVQHYTYTSTLSGRHKPGITGALYANTTTNINALSATAQSGALAWDTTLGALKRFHGVANAGTWKQVNLDNLPIVDVYMAGDQTVASAATVTYTAIKLDTETKDVMGSFNTTTYKFISPTAGYYLIKAQATVTPTEAGIDFRLALLHYNSANVLKNAIVKYMFSWAANTGVMTLDAVLEMVATDWLTLALYHDNAISQVVEGGIDYTFLKVYKAA